MTIDCSWDNPGVNPYSGSPRAAIMAFTQIPKAVRIILVARVEGDRLGFNDSVVIDRDSIRGKSGSYAPEINSMHFGSKGKLCDTVSRKNWKDDHTEFGLVYCEMGYCVMLPSVCHNWAIVQRLPDDSGTVVFGDLPTYVTPLPQPVGGAFAPLGYLPPTTGAAAPASPVYAAGAGFYAVPMPMPMPGSFGCCTAIPVIPAVPEPGTWLALLGGVLLLWIWRTVRK